MSNKILNLWAWLYRFSRDKYRDQHLNVYKNDIKCPHCNTWFSVSGIDYEHEMFDTDFGCKCLCGKCDNLSYWNLEIAPVAISCDENGVPNDTK